MISYYLVLVIFFAIDISYSGAFHASTSRIVFPSEYSLEALPNCHSLSTIKHHDRCTSSSFAQLDQRHHSSFHSQTRLLALASNNNFLSPFSQPRKDDSINVSIEAPSLNSRRITASVLIEGTIDDVWSIITDYNNLAKHVPNLVKSNVVPGPPGTIRLFQEGAQKIIGFDFRASLTMDMTEEPMDTSRALPMRQLRFKLVDSLMFSAFEGSWTLKYHKRTPTIDPATKEISYNYTTSLTYTVLVRPKGPVPVIALEWRIKEDVPTNLLAMKIASEKVSALRRSNASLLSGGGGGEKAKAWATSETLGLYMVNSRRMRE